MHYPWWYVPYLTAPMLIAVVAVLHVLVSHYAVGGGLFLAVEVGHAYRTRDRNYLEYLHRHAGFFILVTVVFGAISGVGIWWTIGLTSPLATEVLIRTFVFGWATEWVFFVVESSRRSSSTITGAGSAKRRTSSSAGSMRRRRGSAWCSSPASRRSWSIRGCGPRPIRSCRISGRPSSIRSSCRRPLPAPAGPCS